MTPLNTEAPAELYRGDHHLTQPFTMAGHVIQCIWFTDNYEEARDIALYRKRDRQLPQCYVYTCQIGFRNILRFPNEPAIYASVPGSGGPAHLAAASMAARAQGYDGLRDDQNQRAPNGPTWYGALDTSLIKIVKVQIV